MICLLFRVLDFLLMPRFKIATTLQDDLDQAVVRELQPPIADRATLEALLVRTAWPVAATYPRADAWVKLVCDEAYITRRTGPDEMEVIEHPLEQWAFVYYRSSLELMN